MSVFLSLFACFVRMRLYFGALPGCNGSLHAYTGLLLSCYVLPLNNSGSLFSYIISWPGCNETLFACLLIIAGCLRTIASMHYTVAGLHQVIAGWNRVVASRIWTISVQQWTIAMQQRIIAEQQWTIAGLQLRLASLLYHFCSLYGELSARLWCDYGML